MKATCSRSEQLMLTKRRSEDLSPAGEVLVRQAYETLGLTMIGPCWCMS